MKKTYFKKKLKEVESELDAEFGKMKRLFLHGFVSKPAWARAAVWLLLGIVTALALR